MIAETLAGISLVKASVDFIKSNIDTAKDIGEIASAVDGLFRGADEVEKKRSRKAGVGIKDQFGIQSVAQEVIDARLAQEAMQEMKTMINMRFGPDTWQSIVDLRAKRIQEEKERIQEQNRIARQRKKERDEIILVVGSVLTVAIILLLAVVGFVKLV